MRFSVVVRRLPPPFYTTVKTKSNLTEFGLEKFRNTELEFETIGIISKFIINESRDPQITRSELVRNFQNFVCPCPDSGPRFSNYYWPFFGPRLFFVLFLNFFVLPGPSCRSGFLKWQETEIIFFWSKNRF